MATPFGQTADGFETAVRHQPSRPLRLGQPHRLADCAGRAAGELSARPAIASPTSISTTRISSAPPTTRLVAYGRSKTANILFAVEFDRRHQGARHARDGGPSGRHPDRARRHIDPEALEPARRGIDAELRRAGRAALPVQDHPARCRDQRLGGRGGDGRRGRRALLRGLPRDHADHDGPITVASGGVRPYALDPEHAKALWAKSEELVGERF